MDGFSSVPSPAGLSLSLPCLAKPLLPSNAAPPPAPLLFGGRQDESSYQSHQAQLECFPFFSPAGLLKGAHLWRGRHSDIAHKPTATLNHLARKLALRRQVFVSGEFSGPKAFEHNNYIVRAEFGIMCVF